jgi:hypothetical protein
VANRDPVAGPVESYNAILCSLQIELAFVSAFVAAEHADFLKTI